MDDDDFEEEYDEYDEEDEELDEEDEDGDDEESEESEDDEADDEEGSKKQISPQLYRQFVKIEKHAPQKIFPFFTKKEKEIINAARKYMPTRVIELELKMKQRKAQFWAKVKSILAVAVPFILVLGFILLIAALVGAVLEAMFPWLFGGSSGNGGMSSPNGIKGADFYGIRTIYRDQEKSQNELIKNYANTIVEIKTDLDADGGLQITINLLPDAEKTLPAEDYDYSQFAADYSGTNLYNLVNLIADTVYLADNPEGTASTFSDKIAGIKYFGYNQAISEEISNKVRDYLLGKSGAISLDEGNETQPTSQALGEKISASINPTAQQRTEMVYVKDYILEGDEDYAKNIAAENYLAFIFMPKKGVNFSELSFNLGNIENIGDLKVYLNGENGAELTPYLFLEGENYQDTIYQVEYTQNLSAAVFANIESGVTSADNPLADGLSLYEILNSNLTKDFYLKLPAAESETNDVYTYVADGVGLRFENQTDSKFYCAEHETLWK